MNVFMLDHDPRIAAIYMVDRHVTKMIVESAQLLSTAHRVLDGDENGTLFDEREEVLYRRTHRNHPSAKWVRESVSNYLWLVEHLRALLEEYTYRYGKTHATSRLMYMLQSPPHGLRAFDATPVKCAMPDEYVVSEDPVVNYRNYYRLAKSNLHSWKKRGRPDWL